tara:strand:- start:19 stop:435 length:417 start_codon:yes stop_codon:yes gene_type:complete
MLKVKGYITGSFLGERVPQRVQSLVIQDYCKSNGLHHLFNYSEYLIDGSTHIIKDLMNQLKEVNGIVAYSIFQMPYNNITRLEIFKKVLKKRKKLFFALEDLRLENKDDLKDLNNLWLIKKNLKFCRKLDKNDKIFKS